jgi:hypothetical protein
LSGSCDLRSLLARCIEAKSVKQPHYPKAISKVVALKKCVGIATEPSGREISMSAISSTFESKEPLLSELMKEIHTGKIQLPDFQRPWVWDDTHIRSLLASVSLAYPIGAIMLLQTGGAEVRFRPRPVEGVRNNALVAPERLILDGQQRLTSLYGALMSKHPVNTKDEKRQPLKRWYYMDIEKSLDPETDRLDAILSIPEDRCIRKSFGREIELDLTTRENELELGIVPMNILLGTEFSAWRTDYMKYHGMDSERVNVITEFEQEIWMRFQQFKVPVIELLGGTPKEAICQVFEKVNTGGVALTVFELMIATFAADNFQLREDWERRQEVLHERDVLKSIGGTEFLQAVTLLARYKRFRDDGRAVSVKRGDVLNLSLDEYRANSDEVQQGLLRAARLLNRSKIFDDKNLPYGTQLIPLGTVCGYIGNRFEEDIVRNKLSRWYWCGVFGEMYGGANETRYAMDVVDLISWIMESGPEPRTIRDADFSPLRLLTLQSRLSAAYKGLFALMVQNGSYDFVNGDPIAHTTDFELPVDIHHIFPKAWCQRQGIPRQKWNSVINKAPLTSRTNRKLSGSAPSQYVQRLLRDGVISDERLGFVLESHWINYETLITDDFEVFFHERAVSLLNAIEDAMGKRVQGRDSEEVFNAFGKPL